MRDKEKEHSKQTKPDEEGAGDGIARSSASSHEIKQRSEAENQGHRATKATKDAHNNVKAREPYKPNDPKMQLYLAFRSWQTWSPLITVCVSVLALGAIIAQVVVYLQQRDLMRDQRIALDKQVEEMRRGVGEAVQTRVVENRAYVNVLGGEVTLPIKVQTITPVDLMVRNTGKIPAHNVEDRIDCRFVAQDSDTPVPAQCNPPSHGAASAIIPSGTEEIIRVSVTPMTEQQLAMLAKGKLHVVISGYLVYQDNFNLGRDPNGQPLPPYQDPFCFAMYGPGEKLLQPCRPYDWKWAALMMQ